MIEDLGGGGGMCGGPDVLHESTSVHERFKDMHANHTSCDTGPYFIKLSIY